MGKTFKIYILLIKLKCDYIHDGSTRGPLLPERESGLYKKKHSLCGCFFSLVYTLKNYDEGHYQVILFHSKVQREYCFLEKIYNHMMDNTI